MILTADNTWQDHDLTANQSTIAQNKDALLEIAIVVQLAAPTEALFIARNFFSLLPGEDRLLVAGAGANKIWYRVVLKTLATETANMYIEG